MKILISDEISEICLDVFAKRGGFDVVYEPGLGKNPALLAQKIVDVDALIVRSATKVTASIFAAAKKLKVVGRAGIGVDNIDVEAASKQGVIVMNTPHGNMVTTAEHALAMLFSLIRSVPQATASIKAGKWEKNRFLGNEMFQKTLGILGCGNIGKIVADRALGLKMKVIAYDPFLSDDMARDLGIHKVSFDELLRTSHAITIHTPYSERTHHIINQDAFSKMRPGVFLINCARGGLVDEAALAWAIEQKIVHGAALDVFEQEPPPPDHPLLKMENVICTPHLGAATEEAQENVARDVANQIADYLRSGVIVNAVNTPSASPEAYQFLQPYIRLAQKMGALQGQLCQSAPQGIHIRYYGDILKHPTACLTSAILQGVLGAMSSAMSVNAVNAPYLAKERGIQIQETKINSHSDYASLIEVEVTFSGGSHTCAGVVFGKNQPRIVAFNHVRVEFNPEGPLLLVDNEDKPGVLGRIGTYLGAQGVNIAHAQLGLDATTGTATAFYTVSNSVTDSVLHGLRKLDGVLSACQLKL